MPLASLPSSREYVKSITISIKSKTERRRRESMEISSARSAAAATVVPLLLLVVLMLPHSHAHRGSSHMGHQGKPAGPHKNKPPFRPGPWKNAHATFYGSSDGSDTYEGACGYEQKNGYGLQTAAISQAMFNNGQVCGACFELKCFNDPQWCKPGQPSITITATNLCPPSEQQSSENGGWCNPPREHFDLTQPAFLQLSSSVTAGILPVQYRRVPCPRQGGIRFTITGNPYFNLVQVTNVGGAGDVTSLQVKGHKELKWTQLTRNWGQKWQTDCKLVGESLTFRVGTSDGRFSTSWHVAPKDWQFGQTFEGKNFKK